MSMDLKNLMTTLVMVIRVDMVTTPVGISATLPPTTVKSRLRTKAGGVGKAVALPVGATV